MTDEELALAYIDGDCQAFDLLLQRSQSRLYAYILFVVHDRDVAEDVFQETFVKVIVKLQQRKYRVQGKFLAWAMRIAHNIIMDQYRDQRQCGVVETADASDPSGLAGVRILEDNVEARYVNEQVLADVRRMIDWLPAPQREVVYMRYYQEMSFKEIAEATGVSINTALGRMRYAVLNLRRLTRQHGISLQMV